MSSVTTSAKATALDALQITLASLHDGFPGTVGSSEISGGTYARMTIAFAAASGNSRLLSAGVTFDVPACTVRWVAFRKTDGTLLFSAPNGGATPRNFMSIAGTDTVYAAGHGYADTDTIVFYSGTPPAPLVEGTVYYVRDATTDTFKVAATSGGTAIDLTAAPSYNCSVCAITEEVYAAVSTHTLSSATVSIPD